MKVSIRNGVFETNSSSTHSFTIIKNEQLKVEELKKVNEEADKVSELLTFIEEEQVEVTSESLAGQSICITGTLIRFKNRSELTDVIIKNGGKVVSSVSKNTTMLINNNLNSTSAKNKAAKTLGIPIITEEKFLEMI